MKKISRRSFLTAAAACGAAAALSACGGSSASSTAASSAAGSTAASAAAGPVTLQWSVWDKESTPYWQAMADLENLSEQFIIRILLLLMVSSLVLMLKKLLP